MEESGGGIGGQHEVLADEESIEAHAAKFLEVGVGAEAGFGYGEAVIGNLFDQLERSFHAHREGFQIAIVDADDAGIRGKGAIEFGAGVDFDKRLHCEIAAEGEEVAQE